MKRTKHLTAGCALCFFLSGLCSMLPVKNVKKQNQRLHFGLGAATKCDKVEIRWPSGLKQEITVPAVDRIYTIWEGKDIIAP